MLIILKNIELNLLRFKHILVFVLLALCYNLSAQDKPKRSLKIRHAHKPVATRAVIVGVSDYDNEQIPDLNYAHKDAEAFANFLKSKAGGSVPSDNIRVLLNEKATGGNVHNALDWIVDATKKNDHCFIYFAGHGDVETLFEKEPGHFLVYDSPSSTYQINSLRVEDLQQIVRKLTTETEAKVTVITDACRSGKLAGSGINGAQATAAALLNQFDNEIKIMSCQADEYSQEGEQWGGGRGLFSYHMIEGLVGMADNNENGEVSLKELHRYLEDRFEEDLEHGSQTPVIVGDRKSKLAIVDPELLEKIKTDKGELLQPAEELIAVAPSESEDDLLGKFYQSLKQKILLEESVVDSTGLRSTEYYLALIEQDESLNSRAPLLKGDYIAALQNDSHEAINRYLSLDKEEINNRWFESNNSFDIYSKYLGKAASLLGEFHYIYPQVKTKEIYFQVVAERIRLDRQNARPEEYQDLINQLNEALKFQARSPFVYNELGVLYIRTMEYDKAMEEFQRTIDISPTWALPYSNRSEVYSLTGEYELGVTQSLKAIELNPNFISSYLHLAFQYSNLGNFELAVAACNNYKEIAPNSCMAYNALGHVYMLQGNSSLSKVQFEKSIDCDPTSKLGFIYMSQLLTSQNDCHAAIQYLNKAEKIDSFDIEIQTYLGYCYWMINDFRNSLIHYERASSIDTSSLSLRNNLAIAYLKDLNLNAALAQFEYIMQNSSPKDMWFYFDYACTLAALDDLEGFETYINKAIEMGFNSKKEMEESVHLSSIRSTKEYLSIISKLSN